MLLIDLSFEHSYQVREPEQSDVSGEESSLFFGPSKKEAVERIVVVPKTGRAWTAEFSVDYDVPPAVSGVYATPDPDKVCVVVGGCGYMISALQPSEYQRISCFPIVAVAQATKASRIVFADFTNLAAWDRSQETWRSDRASVDGIEFLNFNGSTLFARGWEDDGSTLQPFEFRVDLVSGSLSGVSEQTINYGKQRN